MIFSDPYPVHYALVIFLRFETTVAGEAYAVVALIYGPESTYGARLEPVLLITNPERIKPSTDVLLAVPRRAKKS